MSYFPLSLFTFSADFLVLSLFCRSCHGLNEVWAVPGHGMPPFMKITGSACGSNIYRGAAACLNSFYGMPHTSSHFCPHQSFLDITLASLFLQSMVDFSGPCCCAQPSLLHRQSRAKISALPDSGPTHCIACRGLLSRRLMGFPKAMGKMAGENALCLSHASIP
jgi:hypothetical protein